MSPCQAMRIAIPYRAAKLSPELYRSYTCPKKNTNRHCQYSVSTCLKQREQSALSPRKNIQIKQQLARRTRGACGCEKRQRSSHAQLCYSSSVATCQQNGHWSTSHAVLFSKCSILAARWNRLHTRGVTDCVMLRIATCVWLHVTSAGEQRSIGPQPLHFCIWSTRSRSSSVPVKTAPSTFLIGLRC